MAPAPTRLEWIKVLQPDDLAEGGVRGVRCAGHDLCLVRHQGATSAFEDVCPHQGAPLSNGWIWDGWLVCPHHGWAFDPKTGASGNGSGAGIGKYRLQERDDGVYVQLPVAEPSGGAESPGGESGGG